MGTTQLDIIRRQAEAAARNAASGAAARLRRETSLVGQASRLTGRALRDGEAALRDRAGARKRSWSGRRQRDETVEGPTPPPRPAEDGYVRRSPVQPIREAADYRRRILLRAVGAAALAAAACAGIVFLSRLGLLGW